MTVSAPLGGLWGQQSAGVEQDGQMSLIVFCLNFALVGGITFAENWLKMCERLAVDGVAGCPMFFFFMRSNFQIITPYTYYLHGGSVSNRG